jgi:hypothetical protein
MGVSESAPVVRGHTYRGEKLVQDFTRSLTTTCRGCAGDIVFWKKENKGVCKQMAATRAPAVKAAWSPCGRYLMTAIVAPRLRVDNNVRVFDYVGEFQGLGLGCSMQGCLCVPLVRGPFSRVSSRGVYVCRQSS